MSHIDLKITYRDDKTQRFKCTDLPTISSDWITVYRNLRRDFIPAQTVKRISYDVKADKPRKA